jgi:integrase
VAYEAADSGLLSAELAAGNRRVKGARRIGVRLGNWLTADQGRSLLLNSHGHSLRSKRNYAILALLIGCGLRRGELLAPSAASVQLREHHWVIVDLHGKAGHIRTVPISIWAKEALDRWTEASGIKDGCLFIAINKLGTIWATDDAEGAFGRSLGIPPKANTDSGGTRTAFRAEGERFSERSDAGWFL